MVEALFQNPSFVALSIAIVLQILASSWYLASIFQHQVTLNPASWALWFCLTSLNTLSYFFTSNTPEFAIIPALSALSTASVFLAAMRTHAKAPIDWLDEAAVVIGIIAAGAWLGSGSAASASVILQVAFLIGFLPTYRSLLNGKSHEPIGPWAVWMIAYLFNLTAVALSGSERPVEFAYPFTAVMLHAGVVSIAFAAMVGGKLERVRVATIKAIGI